MTRYLLIAVLSILAVYGLIEGWPLLSGPSLSVTAPLENGSYPGGIVTITGKATRIAMLSLNGNPLLHDENGDFTTTLTFPHGASILTFVATDRFGRHVTETRTIFVPDSSTSTPNQ